jgi:hypothetical protein
MPSAARRQDRVRHAGRDGLDQVEPLLQELRALPGLVERKRGVFYRKSKAFLHFHEDPSGLHADVKLTEDFERFRVETEEERSALLARIEEAGLRPRQLP